MAISIEVQGPQILRYAMPPKLPVAHQTTSRTDKMILQAMGCMFDTPDLHHSFGTSTLELLCYRIYWQKPKMLCNSVGGQNTAHFVLLG